MSNPKFGTFGNKYRPQERYLCPICQVWLQNNKQAIANHEQGGKHKEKLREKLDAKRDNQRDVQKKNKELQEELHRINGEADDAMGSTSGANLSTSSSHNNKEHYQEVRDSENDSWAKRKQQREEGNTNNGKKKALNNENDVEKFRKMAGYNEGGTDKDKERVFVGNNVEKSRKFDETVESHYTINHITYLDAEFFADLIRTDCEVEYYLKKGVGGGGGGGGGG